MQKTKNLIYCQGIILLYTFICISYFFTGCQKDPAPKRHAESKEDLPGHITQEPLDTCLCRPVSEYFLRAELGLDPTRLDLGKWDSAAQLFAVFKQDANDADKPQVIRRTIDDCLAELIEKNDIGASKLTLLEHESGHLYLLLGTMDIGGETVFQLVHGESSIVLLNQEEIIKSGFKNAWQFSKNKEGVTFTDDMGTLLSIDKVYHNFSEVNPNETLMCSFTVKNTGENDFILNKPRGSCSCTVSCIKEPVILKPSEEKKVDVQIHHSNQTSFRHKLFFTFSSPGGSNILAFPVEVYGCQEQTLEVIPARIDFGTVQNGTKANRTITLSEVPTDHFEINSVEFEYPMNYEINTRTAKNGLRINQINLSLPFEGDPGEEKNGELIIRTSSLHLPEICVPVKYTITPDYSVSIESISFGTVSLNQTYSSNLKILSHTDEAIENIEFESVPECIRVGEKNVKDNSTSYPIDFTPDSTGIYSQKIAFSITSNGHSRRITIPVIAFVESGG